MTRGRGWRRIFRLDVGRGHVERDVDEEIAFHIEMRTRRLIESGVLPDAARALALAQFGDLPGVRDECLSIGRDRERQGAGESSSKREAGCVHG